MDAEKKLGSPTTIPMFLQQLSVQPIFVGQTVYGNMQQCVVPKTPKACVNRFNVEYGRKDAGSAFTGRRETFIMKSKRSAIALNQTSMTISFSVHNTFPVVSVRILKVLELSQRLPVGLSSRSSKL